MVWDYIVILFWSLVVITWASYGMHVVREYINVRLRDGEWYGTNDEEAKSV